MFTAVTLAAARAALEVVQMCISYHCKKMPGAGITHAGQMLINSQYMCFVTRVVHAVNVNAGRFSPGCPQSYDDTAGNAGDLVAAIIVHIPMPEALRD